MKDATIETISQVIPHPNADRLDIVTVLGFNCITEKGLYQGGETIVYIRPDTVLPIADWTEGYRKYAPKRVKAVKLRGEYSEGIIVRLDNLPIDLSGYGIGHDVSELIDVKHYEPPVPQDLAAKGFLPLGIGKTDEERFENIVDKLPYDEYVDVWLKVDGQSASYYYNIETDTFGVLGRTLELKPEKKNNYTDHVERYDIKNKLIAFCKKHNRSLCIRGESYGMGIQGMKQNPHSKKDKGWVMFSVYDIGDRKYHRKGSDLYFKNVAHELGLPIVDLVEENVPLTKELIKKYSIELDKINGVPFEGVVVQYSRGSFKIINKSYDSNK